MFMAIFFYFTLSLRTKTPITILLKSYTNEYKTLKFSNNKIHGFNCTKPVGCIKLCVYFHPVGYSDSPQATVQL